MAFTIPDILAPASESRTDMGARATTASASTDGRKSFSAVLQGVREDGRRTETRGVDDGRSTTRGYHKTRSTDAKAQGPSPAHSDRADGQPTNKVDHKERSIDVKEQNPSSAHSERTDRTMSQTKVADEHKSSDAVEGEAKDSKSDVASSTEEQSTGGSDVQGRTSESLSPVMTPQAVAQAVSQIDAHVEGEKFSTTREPASSTQPSSESQSHSPVGLLSPMIASSRATSSPLTVPDSAGTSAPTDAQGSSQHNGQTQAPDAPVISAKTGSVLTQMLKPGSPVAGEAVKPETTHPHDVRPTTLDSQLLSAVPQKDAIASGPAPAHVEAAVPNGKSETAKTDILSRAGVPFDRIVSTEGNKNEAPFRDHPDAAGRIIPVSPYGPGSSLEGEEGFTEFLGNHSSAQQDQPEAKRLQQTAAGDRSVSGEQPPESLMAGAQGRAIASPPPPASATHSVGQSAPPVPTHDHAEQVARAMTRSVVFHVAQPDIGQVNIRVALTNDVVHTHLSADRPEVGQFFINGQDRLQAAFQASGLDMGQFRVDIDRQNSGRSFYHGSSPEQGQTWNQGAQEQGMKWEQGRDRQEAQGTSLYGLLNVVA